MAMLPLAAARVARHAQVESFHCVLCFDPQRFARRGGAAQHAVEKFPAAVLLALVVPLFPHHGECRQVEQICILCL